MSETVTVAAKAPSIRLTNYDRDGIVGVAIEAAFKDRDAASAKEADRLARLCYEHVFSAKDRKAAAALPEGWLRLDSCLRFNVGGMDVRLDLAGDGLPVPHDQRGYCRRLGSIAAPDLVAEVTTHLSEIEQQKSDRTKARKSLKGLLYSVTTLKALRDLWPEGEPYYGHLVSKTGAPGLPAPQISELNAMLGLAQAA